MSDQAKQPPDQPKEPADQAKEPPTDPYRGWRYMVLPWLQTLMFLPFLFFAGIVGGIVALVFLAIKGFVKGSAALGSATNVWWHRLMRGSHINNALNNKSSRIRAAAVRGLAVAPNHEAVATLVAVLYDPDEGVRIAVAQALALLAPTKRRLLQELAVEPLIASLQDPSATVRIEVVLALGRIADPRAVEPLGLRLSDESGEVRLQTVLAFGYFGEQLDTSEVWNDVGQEPNAWATIPDIRNWGPRTSPADHAARVRIVELLTEAMVDATTRTRLQA